MRHAVGSSLRAAWSYLRSAPGTFTWLAVLLITSVIIAWVPAPQAHHILAWHSTNLHHLGRMPVRVLITSALWIDPGDWWGYLVLFNVFHVAAERWLGTWRWLVVVLVAHIGATYASQGLMALAIATGQEPADAARDLDYGVSYGLLGVITALTYRISRPWRYPYIIAVLLVCTLGLATQNGVAGTGHLAAALLGLACYPLTRARRGVWDPAGSARALRLRWSSRGTPRR